MANIIVPPEWRVPDREVTPEAVYRTRRRFLKEMGFAGMGVSALLASGGLLGCAGAESPARAAEGTGSAGGSDDVLSPYDPITHTENAKYAVDRPITEPKLSTRYNNSYEFTTDKDRVWKLAQDFTMEPWEVEISGHAENTGVFSYDEMIPMDQLEERNYRFRCVEAWAMTVPWVGVPFSRVLDFARPTDKATHVRFVSVLRPEEMPGQKRQTWYPWPFYEGLRMDEARNELTMAVVGMYGRELSPQNGGPLRIITPWKYGYKSPKYIQKIEFVDSEPPTFWNDLAPNEYSFLSNVNPNVPHPRWSQANERLIGEDREVPTRIYNGYGDYVAGMYG